MKKWTAWTFCFLFAAGNPLYSQRISSEVVLNTNRLIADQKRPLQNLQAKLEEYLDHYTWITDSYDTDVHLKIQILIETYTKVGFEDTYSAQIVVTHTAIGEQIYDKEWKFVYQENDALYHNETQFHPLTSLIDYYVYWMLGQELDSYGPFLGTPMFEKGQTIIYQGKFSKYSKEWQSREAVMLEFLNPNNRPFREMKSVYFDALWRLDDSQTERAKTEYDRSVEFINDALRINPRNRFVIRFFEAHYQDFPRFWAGDTDHKRYDRILQLDPDLKRRDFYQRTWSEVQK